MSEEEDSIICPECLKKFDRTKASYTQIGDDSVPICPFCGVVSYPRVVDESEGVKEEDIPDDPLPEGGENPVSVEL